MEQIKNYNQISPLVSSQLRRGIRTNNFMSAADYQAEIASGSLYAHVWPGGLIFLRLREGYQQLNFYLNDLGIPPDIPIDDATVLEIPSRPKDKCSDELPRYWENLGFVLCFERMRLFRPSGRPTPLGNSEVSIREALPADCGPLLKLMAECFDPFTGCIPTIRELLADINDRSVFCAEAEDRALCGLLHSCRAATSTEIRHLAVRENMRGQHIARHLFLLYMAQTEQQKSLVWARIDNKPALHFYDSCGYVADGWTSAVLMKH